MNAQLETLLQIQDLKGQRKELEDAGGGREIQEAEFNLDVETAIRELDGKIEELESDLDPLTRKRYERLSTGMSRAVVPAINGTCYGCFVAVPTSVSSDQTERNALRTCDHCGRFLYFVH